MPRQQSPRFNPINTRKQQTTHISETTGTGAYCVTRTAKKIAWEKAAADRRYDSTDQPDRQEHKPL